MHPSTTEPASTPGTIAGTRPGRRPSRLARALLGATALALVAAAIKVAFLVRDQQRFPPSGELVRLSDGRSLHLDVSGPGNGGPTVILDAGHGAFSPAMRHLQQVDGPFIVVGHSLGGLHARGFANSYPQEVVDLVLIDPAQEHQRDRLPDEAVAQMGPPAWLARPLLAAPPISVSCHAPARPTGPT